MKCPWTYCRLGDPTAKLMGRLTLNPKNHIDPFMSIALPLILILSGSPVIFGAAKPVPVDPFNLRDKRKDMAIVSLAGPATNISIAILAAFILKILAMVSFFGAFQIYMLWFLLIVVKLNLLLAIFNLIPILFGSKFCLAFTGKRSQYLSFNRRIAYLFCFFLMMFPIGGFSLGGFYL
jgi:Zn-dependent protease